MNRSVGEFCLESFEVNEAGAERFEPEARDVADAAEGVFEKRTFFQQLIEDVCDLKKQVKILPDYP